MSLARPTCSRLANIRAGNVSRQHPVPGGVLPVTREGPAAFFESWCVVRDHVVFPALPRCSHHRLLANPSQPRSSPRPDESVCHRRPGMCEVSYGQIRNSAGSVRFTVSVVSLDGFVYDTAASDTSITCSTRTVTATRSEDAVPRARIRATRMTPQRVRSTSARTELGWRSRDDRYRAGVPAVVEAIRQPSPCRPPSLQTRLRRSPRSLRTGRGRIPTGVLPRGRCPGRACPAPPGPRTPARRSDARAARPEFREVGIARG
jgi:hypothetical protein